MNVRGGALALAVLVWLGCESPDTLSVDLRTDYTLGRDFVRVEIEHGRGRPADDGTWPGAETRTADGLAGSDLVVGARIAEIDAASGTHYLRVRLVAEAGEPIATRFVSVRLRGPTGVTVVVARSCEGVRCDPDGACVRGRCVDEGCAQPTDEACGPPECAEDADCAPLSECTDARCFFGDCLVFARDPRCDPGSVCDARAGCRPEGAPVDAGPRCVEDGDCDDGSPCTADTCVDMECVRAPVEGPCDDGEFCNGEDACSEGVCAVHAGPPCGEDTCDEGADRCIECLVDADCGEVIVGDWSACAFAPCATTGTRTRTVTGSRCDAFVCVSAPGEESEACTRPSQETLPCAGDPRYRCCGPECVDIAVDVRHCGGCGLGCAPGFACGARGFLPTCTCATNAQCVTGVCSGGGLCSCDPAFGGRCPPGMACASIPDGADVCYYP